jgi:hypothetical protein
VYGQEARIPTNNMLQMYKFIQEYDDDILDDMQVRINVMIELGETRRVDQKNNIKM